MASRRVSSAIQGLQTLVIVPDKRKSVLSALFFALTAANDISHLHLTFADIECTCHTRSATVGREPTLLTTPKKRGVTRRSARAHMNADLLVLACVRFFPKDLERDSKDEQITISQMTAKRKRGNHHSLIQLPQ